MIINLSLYLNWKGNDKTNVYMFGKTYEDYYKFYSNASCLQKSMVSFLFF